MSAMRIEADEDKCLAYGNCVAAAPDVYEVVDQKVRILEPEPGPEALPAARKGVRRCPAKALRLVDDA
ncbi:hypothetical protein GCM10009613_09430 [Pseudonocardia kongjuensis]|uniref:Ferredoxin n=1 Tax=Pseudonocardia kongjuensis TaxID=102227 RepID=A0ABP4I7R3_9PSEU